MTNERINHATSFYWCQTDMFGLFWTRRPHQAAAAAVSWPQTLSDTPLTHIHVSVLSELWQTFADGANSHNSTCDSKWKKKHLKLFILEL